MLKDAAREHAQDEHDRRGEDQGHGRVDVAALEHGGHEPFDPTVCAQLGRGDRDHQDTHEEEQGPPDALHREAKDRANASPQREADLEPTFRPAELAESDDLIADLIDQKPGR